MSCYISWLIYFNIWSLQVSGESHIDFRTQCLITTQITWHPHPVLYLWFPNFRQNFSLTSKKVYYIKSLKNRLIYMQLLVSFFLFRCEIQEEIEPSWRNYIIWTPHGGESKIRQMQKIHISLSYRKLQNCKWFFELRTIYA